MNEDIIVRIKKIMAAKGISQAELVRRTRLPASSVSDWLSGKYIPKQDKIDLMATALGVSPAWLMYGKEEVEPYYTDPETARMAQEAAKDPDFRLFLDAKRDLPPEDMKMIIDLVRRLMNRNRD